MNALRNTYVKIFVYIIAFAAMFELMRLALWLMTQPSTLAVYAGFIIALALIIAFVMIFLTVSQKAITYFKKPEEK